MSREGECFFHTGKPAVTRCKQCGKPLCSYCRLITEDGIFCSNKCAQAGSVFVKRSQELEERDSVRRRRVPAGLIKFIVFLIIVLILYKVGKVLAARGFFENLLQTIKRAG